MLVRSRLLAGSNKLTHVCAVIAGSNEIRCVSVWLFSMQRCFFPSQPHPASSAARPASDNARKSARRPLVQFRWDGVAYVLSSAAQPATHSGSSVSMLRVASVFGDVALLQLVCQYLFGDAKGISLALPNGQLRLPGMRYVLHLLASCHQLMMLHRSLTRQWRAQFHLDEQYEAETEAKHDSIFGSSPEPDHDTEDSYYARQQNGPDGQPEMSAAELEHQFSLSPDEPDMSNREFFYRTSEIYDTYKDKYR